LTVRAAFRIDVDVSEIDALADSLLRIDAGSLATIRRGAIDAVTLNVSRDATRDATKHLNLSRDLIEARLDRDAATDSGTRGAVRSPIEGLSLRNYGLGATQLFKPVNWTNQEILAAGHSFGTKRGYSRRAGRVLGDWTIRKGDEKRGIPANFKSNGVASATLQGRNAARIATAFTMPINRGKEKGGNGMGVFQWGKNKRGVRKAELLFGPNVYHTFRRYIDANSAEIEETLLEEFYAGFDTAIDRIGK
jgi:hypothetical protein